MNAPTLQRWRAFFCPKQKNEKANKRKGKKKRTGEEHHPLKPAVDFVRSLRFMIGSLCCGKMGVNRVVEVKGSLES